MSDWFSLKLCSSNWNLFYSCFQDWLERHGRGEEAASLEVPDLPEIKPPNDKDIPECRLCEDFPVFFKNFDFHKHLADFHFRTQLNNDLPQVIGII